MAILQLDAALLHSAVMSACKTLIAQRQNLNAINLFPVADGDTGDNMAATARSIVTYAKQQPGLELTCKALADAGIMGARGNSGMIFSQFFNGFMEALPLPEPLDTRSFAQLVKTAVQSVRAAILKPVEGTILTVMEVWAACLERDAAHTDCVVELLNQTLPEVQAAVESTRNTLAILREAQVEDAGALGFGFFVEGFASYLANPQPLDDEIEEVPVSENHQHEQPVLGNPPQNRYCTEAIIAGRQLNKSEIVSSLQEHGDSIVLTANQQLCRLHLHCNQPPSVFKILRQHGSIQSPKVEDMLRQYQVMHESRYRIALVTDSSVNIPQAILDDFQIHLINLNVHYDGHDLLDRYCIESKDFYSSLSSLPAYPTTSFPAPALIRERIEYLSLHYDQVLVLSVAKVLSGMHDALCKVADNFSNVHVMDSRLVSGSQGLLLYYAAELIAEGMEIEAIKAALAERAGRTHLFVMVDQFDALIRSGRVSRLKGMFAHYSGVKPIISFDQEGRAVIKDKAFGETKALIKLVNIVTELAKTSSLDNYCIVHAGVPEKAAEFAAMTYEAFGQEPVFVEPVSTAIGLHAGQGCIALGAMFH
ncbi:DegV family protein [Legionella sp. 16cNR16C]|uniref:DegV family protein n=1 Tax=Legionella sp. 16cNR16C TaxID=2905656 RepID=UPI001E5A3D73|nr:DegV family protein [Legionella sp. 16cNR16C]MCE3046211.1 DegV family EDD domain-containing protein [Legionella sp. 16cNR16C]